MAEETYALTERGKSELQNGATSCTPRELEILVLIDGLSAARSLAARAKSVPQAELPGVLQRLVKLGLVQKADGAAAAGLGYSFIGGGELLASASKEADAGTADLQRKGYYVSIARRAARKPALGAKPLVLIVEDDPVLARMLGHLMTLEGFATRTAFRGAEIAAELGRRPPPDVVLLDVVLPDADGFELLQKMKQDPVQRGIPVIMVTGRTTREGVMRGLAGGADGYITKPIQYEALANGVKSVLGLGAGGEEPTAASAEEIGADDTLSELRKEYRRGLQVKMARIEALARTLAPGLPFEELQRMAHSMAGAAPTFGLPQVGAAAKALEEALMARDVGKARSLVGALRTAANAAA
jgi:two-component system OmpR family response regulator